MGIMEEDCISKGNGWLEDKEHPLLAKCVWRLIEGYNYGVM